MNNLQQVTVSEVIENGKNVFVIPNYQRGYRWDKEEVEALLEDIRNVRYSSEILSAEKYCLQPLILKKCPNSSVNNKRFEVIDGQQRLTTIYLILKYFNEENIYNIDFENSGRQKNFRQINSLNEDSLDISNENIDAYYITKAYANIANWMNQNILKRKQNDFLNVLLDQITFIWYEINDDDGNAKDIFRRINSGKLPLTNAELIKALLMLDEYCIKKVFIPEDAAPDVRKIVLQMNQKNLDNERLKIARQWDEIETSLQTRDFWYFLHNFSSDNQYETRIDYVFDMLAKELNKDIDEQIDYEDNKAKFSFLVFSKYIEKLHTEESQSKTLWMTVWNRYMIFKEWYTNNELYHLTGYLLTVNTDINVLLNLRYDQNHKIRDKSMYIDELKKIIRDKLCLTLKTKSRDYADNLERLEYNKNNRKFIMNTLLFFNVVSMLKDNNNKALFEDECSEQFSRFPFFRYKSENYDIEHIHAIASKAPESREDQEQFYKYTKSDLSNNANINNLIDKYDKNEIEFEDLFFKILKEFSDVSNDINNIKNLTLLDQATNRSYKNIPFPGKRSYLLNVIKNGNHFVPICTRNVFLKAYSKFPDPMTHWNLSDMNDYLNAMSDTICNYLCEETK